MRTGGESAELTEGDLLLVRRLYEEADQLVAMNAAAPLPAHTLDQRAKSLVADICFLLTRCSDPERAEMQLRAVAASILKETIDARRDGS